MSVDVQSSSEVLQGLRSFQRSTARYVFSRLYDESHPSLRFLVADEVGLGKTLVARGVIAQAVEHLRSIGDKRVDVVYICSNGAIARQNLRKLNIASEDAIVQADRFTMLTNEVHRLETRSINLIAVTPGTSLEFGNNAGKFSERALLYAVLQRVWGEDALRGSGAERVFYKGITDDRDARGRLKAKADSMTPSPSVIRAFKLELQRLNDQRRASGQPTLKVEFNRLARAFHYKDSVTTHDVTARNRFIVELRRALATVGIEALQPDLVILDEFQRFRSLMDPSDQSWASRLAHELFDYREPVGGRPTRTLLLSATPYQPYTTADDPDGDTHFDDFVQTAAFLLKDDDSVTALRHDLQDLRRSLLYLDIDDGDAAERACRRVGERLRPVMCRTERLASTPDRSGMLTPISMPLHLTHSDVEGYLAASTAAKLLGPNDITEFWKSGPYLLNFMERYALKKAFEDTTNGGETPAGLVEIVEAGKGLLDWDDVSRYEALDPANARLRALEDDTIGRGMWRLLWLPPACPYYDAHGAFDAPEARAFTKRLVFSSWHLVPKVISALLSHSAERKIFEASDTLTARSYEQYSQRPDRYLDFSVSSETGRLESLPSLLLVVPFVALARITDPLTVSAELSGEGGQLPSLDSVRAAVRSKIVSALAPHLAGSATTGPVDQRWYWAAPLLLDLADEEEKTLDYWHQAWPSIWTHDESNDYESDPFYAHLDEALGVATRKREPLGRVPDDLADVLVSAALGSPAMCALRALSRTAQIDIGRDEILLAGAARIAWGFRALMSSPDTTALIRATATTDAFWRAALDYAAAGHLQAVLDEYLHVLKDWRGFLTTTGSSIIDDVAETAFNALSLRTVSYATDIASVSNGTIGVERQWMRGRFAIRFGDQNVDGEKRERRAQQASEAFNSPFWPFILTTTSVGQEGLDFHLYSHAVVHWNLPNNPVDFEQREGRVHRYKGHAIRKNVASTFHSAAMQSPDNPWDAMFEAASDSVDSNSELEPYWVFTPPGSSARIERYVPVLQLSRDAAKLERLLKQVALYRLSFGQPRQQELLKYLEGKISEDDLASIVQRLRVDLSPPTIEGPQAFS